MIYMMYRLNNCAIFSNPTISEMIEKEIASHNSIGYIEEKDISQLEEKGWHRKFFPDSDFNPFYHYYVNTNPFHDLIVLIPIQKCNIVDKFSIINFVKNDIGKYNLLITKCKDIGIFDFQDKLEIRNIDSTDIKDFIRNIINSVDDLKT